MGRTVTSHQKKKPLRSETTSLPLPPLNLFKADILPGIKVEGNVDDFNSNGNVDDFNNNETVAITPSKPNKLLQHNSNKKEICFQANRYFPTYFP